MLGFPPFDVCLPLELMGVIWRWNRWVDFSTSTNPDRESNCLRVLKISVIQEVWCMKKNSFPWSKRVCYFVIDLIWFNTWCIFSPWWLEPREDLLIHPKGCVGPGVVLKVFSGLGHYSWAEVNVLRAGRVTLTQAGPEYRPVNAVFHVTLSSVFFNHTDWFIQKCR